jgi:hypothetical protein
MRSEHVFRERVMYEALLYLMVWLHAACQKGMVGDGGAVV